MPFIDKISGYIPSIPAGIKSTGTEIARGVVLGVKDYAKQAFVGLSIAVMQTAYPSLLFRVVPLAIVIGYGYKSEDKINEAAQKFACAALAVELATSVLFPASVTGRFIVQVAVVAAATTGNVAAIRNGCVAIKRGMENAQPITVRVREAVKGTIEVLMGLYGAHQTFKAISNLYRYEESSAAPVADEPVAKETDAQPTVDETPTEPKQGYPCQMPWDCPPDAPVRQVADGQHPGHGHRVHGRGHGYGHRHHRHHPQHPHPVGEGQAEQVTFCMHDFRRKCGTAVRNLMEKIKVTPEAEKGEGKVEALSVAFTRRACRRPPVAPAAPVDDGGRFPVLASSSGKSPLETHTM